MSVFNKTDHLLLIVEQKIYMKSRFIGFRIAESEYQRLGALSRKSGKSKSEIIRELLMSGEVRERINKDHISIIRQLIGESTNLNQLARKANTFGFTAVANEVESQAKEIRKLINQLKNGS